MVRYGLRPWLAVAIAVVVLVVLSIAPAIVSLTLGAIVVAGLVWMLHRANNGRDYYQLLGDYHGMKSDQADEDRPAE